VYRSLDIKTMEVRYALYSALSTGQTGHSRKDLRKFVAFVVTFIILFHSNFCRSFEDFKKICISNPEPTRHVEYAAIRGCIYAMCVVQVLNNVSPKPLSAKLHERRFNAAIAAKQQWQQETNKKQ